MPASQDQRSREDLRPARKQGSLKTRSRSYRLEVEREVVPSNSGRGRGDPGSCGSCDHGLRPGSVSPQPPGTDSQIPNSDDTVLIVDFLTQCAV